MNSWISKFKNKIDEFEKISQQEKIDLCTMHKNNLKLCLDEQNKFRLYCKDIEFTKGIGLSTVMLSEGKQYASAAFTVTNIEKPSPDEMILYLAHNQLSFTQIWRLKFSAEGMLNWKVDMHLKEPLRIDSRKAVLFLSKAYQNWIAPPKYGYFPIHFNSGWQYVTSSENKPEFIGVFSSTEGLPGIILNNSDKEQKYLLMIQNTDLNLSSRVLEVQLDEEKEYYQPGSYSYLDITLQIYPDRTVLENILEETKERERKKQKEPKEKAYIQLKNDTGLVVFEDEYKNKDGSIYIYGDNEELHDKISSYPGDFKRKFSIMQGNITHGKNIKIGVSRFNFFRLNEIVNFCSFLLGCRIDLRSVSLAYLPANKLYSNFIDYIKELKLHIPSDRISFFLKDKELPGLLNSVSSQADQYNEKDLLRLLGVITEHAFIGPQTIVLDTYHRCNTNCIHCWIHTPKREASQPAINLKMSTPLYKNIINNASDLLCDEIIIQGDGEPLLDSRFLEIVRYARDKGLKVLFFTNGILLDEKNASKIIDLGVNEIFCSLPAGTDNTYATINSAQSKDAFHKIVNNLKNFIFIRNSLKKDKPLLQISHVIHNLNYHELEEMAKIDAYIGADKARFYLARLDENIKFLKLKPDHIKTIRKSLKKVRIYLKKRKVELQDNVFFQLNNYDPLTGYWSKNVFLKSGCPVGWFFSLILAKGEISMCCHLRIIDCIKSKSFKELWNSEDYNKFRVQAKYLIKNKNIVFNNGVKLYDEFCNHCDTHQVILRIYDLIEKYNLHKFL